MFEKVNLFLWIFSTKNYIYINRKKYSYSNIPNTIYVIRNGYVYNRKNFFIKTNKYFELNIYNERIKYTEKEVW